MNTSVVLDKRPGEVLTVSTFFSSTFGVEVTVVFVTVLAAFDLLLLDLLLDLLPERPLLRDRDRLRLLEVDRDFLPFFVDCYIRN